MVENFRIIDKLGKNFKKFKVKIDDLLKNNIKIKIFIEFLLFSISYGLIINYSLNIIFGIKLLWFGFPAYGIAFYFIKEELVSIIKGVITK